MTRLAELRAMRDFIDREIATELTPILPSGHTHLIGDVAGLYGVSVEDMLGGDRRHQVCRARHGAAWLLRRDGMSYPEVSRALGYADHTSAFHAVRKIDADPATRALLLGIEAA